MDSDILYPFYHLVNSPDDAQWHSFPLAFDPISIATHSAIHKTTFNYPSSSSLAGAFGGPHQLPTALPRCPRPQDLTPSPIPTWDPTPYTPDVLMEEEEEEEDEEMEDSPSQHDKWLPVPPMIVKSHTPAFIRKFGSAPTCTSAGPAPPPAPALTPPPPPPPPPPPSPAPPSAPAAPLSANPAKEEDTAVHLALEDYVRRKILRKKHRQHLHVHHHGGKVAVLEGARKGKAKEEGGKKAGPAMTMASLPVPAFTLPVPAPTLPAPPSTPLFPIPPAPTPRAPSPAQLSPGTTTVLGPPPSIFFDPASPPDEMEDDSTLEDDKEKEDADDEAPTTILPPRRRVLESKARLACLFCRGRKIACKPVLPGPEGSGANGGACNQCSRRELECTYPTECRRGKQKKKAGSHAAAAAAAAAAGGTGPSTHRQRLQHAKKKKLRSKSPKVVT